MLSRNTLALTEEGSIGSYTVHLDKAHSGNVQVRADRNSSVIAVRTPGEPWWAYLTLNFTASTWNTGQTVKVNAPDNTNAADASASITYSIVQSTTESDFDNAPNVALAVAPLSLRYSATMWNTGQTVTVSPTNAANDPDGVKRR